VDVLVALDPVPVYYLGHHGDEFGEEPRRSPKSLSPVPHRPPQYSAKDVTERGEQGQATGQTAGRGSSTHDDTVTREEEDDSRGTGALLSPATFVGRRGAVRYGEC